MTVADATHKIQVAGLWGYDNAAGANAALTNVVVTYEVSLWNPSTNTWNAPVTVQSAVIPTLPADNTIEAIGGSANLIYGGTTQSFRVTVTVASDQVTKTYAPVAVTSA